MDYEINIKLCIVMATGIAIRVLVWALGAEGAGGAITIAAAIVLTIGKLVYAKSRVNSTVHMVARILAYNFVFCFGFWGPQLIKYAVTP